jgi:subtilase family serine protease
VNTVAPSIPADLVASVDGVTGLSEVFARPNHVGARDEIPGAAAESATAAAVAGPNAPPSPGFRNAPPCSNFWAEKMATGLPPLGNGYPNPLPWAPCGLKPGQLRSAYGTASTVASGIDGRGVTVAIVDAFASPTIFEDASTYSQRNDPSHPLARNQFSQNNFRPQRFQKECDIQGWYGEETLDVEAVHAMAPGANILYTGARSCADADLTDAVADIVDHERADIITNSYGIFGEGTTQADFRSTIKVHTQAAVEGIGIYYSSGDSGDESDSGYGGPVPSADWPASSPLATAVGGTSLGVAADGSVALEHGWTTGVSNLDPASNQWVPGGRGDFLYGAGGGPSRLFGQPDYQKGVVPNDIARGIGAPKRRVVPDVGMVGDPNTGMLVGQTQTFPEGVSYDEFRLGGTSLSSPLFAGVMALADQKAGFNHGFANPFLYSLYGTSAFRDIKPGPKIAVIRRNFVNGTDANDGITPPSARTIDADLQSLRTLNGYDTLTGLGAPNGAAFVNAG